MPSIHPLDSVKTRFIDVVVSSVALLVLWPTLLIIALLIKFTSRGPVLYWSDRVGLHNVIFSMPKFRTMRVDTPSVASHLLANPASHLTSVGGFLRRFSLDELPQLVSILCGDLTLIGPRPALYNQHDLIKLRTGHGIHMLVPGLTGLAQINGRDGLTIEEKVEFDRYYHEHRCALLDINILFNTVVKVIRRDGVSH